MLVSEIVPSLHTSNDLTTLAPANTSVLYVPAGCVLRQFVKYIPWNNEDNIVPKRAEVIVRFIFNALVMPILLLICVPTNITNMIVFYKQGLKERINTCLFALSLADLMFVVSAYGTDCDRIYMFLVGRGAEVGAAYMFFYRSNLIGFYGFVTASQVVSSVIALERCLCVFRPLLAKSLVTTRTTVIFLLLSTVLIVGGYVVVVGLRYSVVCVFDVATNRSSLNAYPSEFYLHNRRIMDFMLSVVYGMLLPVICMTIVTISTVAMVVQMMKLTRWREKVSSASETLTSRDLAVTRMIVGTSVLFIACAVPSFLFRSAVLVFPDFRVGGRHENFYHILVLLYQQTSAVNCTFNFFVYYTFGSKFRETVHQLFSSCGRRKKTVSVVSENVTYDITF